MHSNLKSYILSIFILAIIATSCSKEEYKELTPIEPKITNDTIIIEDQVILRNGEETLSANGVFTSCLAVTTVPPRPDELTFNLFAFGVDLDVDVDPNDWENDVYVMNWYTCGPLETGHYLAEGFLLEAGTLVLIETLYEISVEAITENGIYGNFEMLSDKIEYSSGSFSTTNYGCEMVDPSDELIVTNTYGRLYSDDENETEDLALQCVSLSCEDLFTDISEATTVIFAGGEVYLDNDRQITFDENPEMSILIDPNVNSISSAFQGYILTDLDVLLNSGVAQSFQSLTEMGIPVRVEIIEETESYIKATYSGTTSTGEIISGSFLSEHTTTC